MWCFVVHEQTVLSHLLFSRITELDVFHAEDWETLSVRLCSHVSFSLPHCFNVYPSNLTLIPSSFLPFMFVSPPPVLPFAPYLQGQHSPTLSIPPSLLPCLLLFCPLSSRPLPLSSTWLYLFVLHCSSPVSLNLSPSLWSWRAWRGTRWTCTKPESSSWAWRATGCRAPRPPWPWTPPAPARPRPSSAPSAWTSWPQLAWGWAIWVKTPTNLLRGFCFFLSTMEDKDKTFFFLFLAWNPLKCEYLLQMNVHLCRVCTREFSLFATTTTEDLSEPDVPKASYLRACDSRYTYCFQRPHKSHPLSRRFYTHSTRRDVCPQNEPLDFMRAPKCGNLWSVNHQKKNLNTNSVALVWMNHELMNHGMMESYYGVGVCLSDLSMKAQSSAWKASRFCSVFPWATFNWN